MSLRSLLIPSGGGGVVRVSIFFSAPESFGDGFLGWGNHP